MLLNHFGLKTPALDLKHFTQLLWTEWHFLLCRGAGGLARQGHIWTSAYHHLLTACFKRSGSTPSCCSILVENHWISPCNSFPLFSRQSFLDLNLLALRQETWVIPAAIWAYRYVGTSADDGQPWLSPVMRISQLPKAACLIAWVFPLLHSYREHGCNANKLWIINLALQ